MLLWIKRIVFLRLHLSQIYFLIAGTVFLFLKGKINAYVGYDGAMHDGTALMLIGLALVCIGIGIWIIVWINKRMNR